MKKSTFLKVALTFVAMIFVANSFAQPASYVQATEDTYHTTGKTVRLYAEPDAVYSPGWVLNANSRWTWTYAGLTGAPLTGAVSLNNWVEFSNPAVGNYTINYVESNFTFTCNDGGLSHTLRVIAAPAAAITVSGGLGWTPVVATKEYFRCGDDADGETITVTFTETGVRAIDARYSFRVQRRVFNIDEAGLEVPLTAVESDIADYETGAGLKYHANAVDGGTWTYNQATLPIVASARTKYEYLLFKATGVAGAEGVVSAISHKSDFIDGGITTYPFTGVVIASYVVNPTPVTGPIYHIPNNYAY
jgi:hypothetical protein